MKSYKEMSKEELAALKTELERHMRMQRARA